MKRCLIEVIIVRLIFIDSILLQVATALVMRMLRIRVRFLLLFEFIRESFNQVATDSARDSASTHQHRVGSSTAIRLPSLREELV